MSKINKKMLINVDQPEECRAVVIENGKLAEIIVEHSSRELVKGNIYLGVISRVDLPLLAQAQPGVSSVEFERISVDDAQKLLVDAIKRIENLENPEEEPWMNL